MKVERIPEPAELRPMEASGGFVRWMPRAGQVVVRVSNVRVQKIKSIKYKVQSKMSPLELENLNT